MVWTNGKFILKRGRANYLPWEGGGGPPPPPRRSLFGGCRGLVAQLPELLERDGPRLAFARVHVTDPELGLGPLLTDEDETRGYGCDTQQADDESSDDSSGGR
jgi:hypothetical protein